jgi:hypothetical protein
MLAVDSDTLRLGMAVSDCIDDWLRTSPWFDTLRGLCDEPQQFDSYMTHTALALATPYVVKRCANEQSEAGDVLSAAAMPYFTRYFHGPREQQRAAEALANTVDMQERIAQGSPSIATSGDYCAYLDNMLWAVLLTGDENLKAHSMQNLQSELLRLERDLGRVLAP